MFTIVCAHRCTATKSCTFIVGNFTPQFQGILNERKTPSPIDASPQPMILCALRSWQTRETLQLNKSDPTRLTRTIGEQKGNCVLTTLQPKSPELNSSNRNSHQTKRVKALPQFSSPKRYEDIQGGKAREVCLVATNLLVVNATLLTLYYNKNCVCCIVLIGVPFIPLLSSNRFYILK